MRKIFAAGRVVIVLLLCLNVASAARAAERMTVITYFNMTRSAEEQVKLIDGKWKVFLMNGPENMAVTDIENGYLEFVDEGTGGGKTTISAALFLTKDKAPMLAVLSISGPSGSCPDDAYTLKTYTLQQGKLAEAKDIMPGVPFESFLKKSYDLKKSADYIVAYRDYRVGYRLPRKGTTIEAFLDVSTAECAVGAFGDQMSPEKRNAINELLQNVVKEPVKLKWNKAAGKFELPAGVAAAAPARSVLPGYADHTAKEQFTGKPAGPDYKSDPDAKRFASVLNVGASKGPDFAGRYTVVMWGCGSGCQSFVIVDAKSGAIHSPKLSTERGLCYRKDSRLLIADPITKDFLENGEVPERYRTKYYTWDGKKLDLVAESRSVMQDEHCK